MSRIAFILLALALAAAVAPAWAAEPGDLLRAAMKQACLDPAPAAAAMARAVPGATAGKQTPILRGGRSFGWRREFQLSNGGRIEVRRFAWSGKVRRIDVTLYRRIAGAVRPWIMALVGPDCRIRLARRLVHGTDGRARRIDLLGPDLAPSGTRELLDPPVPPGRDPGGGAVAMVDSGVNYLLRALAARLARDKGGQIRGYDFWDLDPRPFDADPARSPFFPRRHGTRTASVLLREAPGARLVPYRYPRPDMSRLAALVAHADEAGVVVVNLSLGSNKKSEWRAFAAAARSHKHMLFVVSAGNNGRDIDRRPVYPAALALQNMIVVTSAEDDGRLARGSNWGAVSVDLMVPGENIPVINYRGRRRLSSGSSFAAPRVTALAARLLAAHPAWRAKKLKAAILARAKHTKATRGRVAHGWIADKFLTR